MVEGKDEPTEDAVRFLIAVPRRNLVEEFDGRKWGIAVALPAYLA
jgi:hypothetical protein